MSGEAGGKLPTAFISWKELEELLWRALPAILILLVLLVLRFLVNRFISAMHTRKVLSLSVKYILLKVVDYVIILVYLSCLLYIYLPTMPILYVVGLVSAAFILIFFYDVREFLAYFYIIASKYPRGRPVVISIPRYSYRVFGRVNEVHMHGAEVEDFYGNKIYIPNTLLASSITIETPVLVSLRVKALFTDRSRISEEISSLVDRMSKEISQKIPFSFDKESSYIEKIDVDRGEAMLILRFKPLSLPIKRSSTYELTKYIISNYGEVVYVEVVNGLD
ncbi:MAG: mechanosensitive ion channel [Sulfolobales archaeon]|nr:mechanosensitive ion channel [Sulfolobales archaeon]MCX8199508.1 mechanosensitive ion channel [Sulfolobales archaeon]MDW8170461.1 hypothetical protein [Desulfurococcaceae archaeon]